MNGKSEGAPVQLGVYSLQDLYSHRNELLCKIPCSNEKSKEWWTRFAPTPSGFLHLGNLLNLVLILFYARGDGKNSPRGLVRLRVDDLDEIRCRDVYLEELFKTLDWLGVEFDDGPSGVGELKKTFSQSLRVGKYLDWFNAYGRTSGLMYPCDCTRQEVKKRYGNSVYQGYCRNRHVNLKDSVDGVWRIDLSKTSLKSNLVESMGDFIVLRRGGEPAYQLASLVEDAREGVDLVIRGADLFSSTLAQKLLSTLDPSNPLENVLFLHHELLPGPGGLKLSKSIQGQEGGTLREIHGSSSEVFRQLGRILGLMNPNPETLRELLERMEIDFQS